MLLPEWKQEIFSLYNLARMIKELRLWDKVGQELGIKGSSVRRQLDRIIAYFEEREAQKRSGRGKGAIYKEVMRRILEEKLKRPIHTVCLPPWRKVMFDRLEDALRYSEPIANIVGIVYDYEKGVWIVCIPKESVPLTQYDA